MKSPETGATARRGTGRPGPLAVAAVTALAALAVALPTGAAVATDGPTPTDGASPTSTPSPTDTVTPTPTPSETTTPAPSPTPTATPPPPPPPPPPPVRTMKAAQSRLNALGCDAGTADGSGSLRTTAAIVKFQAANSLAQTGALGATFWDAAEASPVRCDERPVPAGSGGGRRIVVSRTQNHVWLVNGDGSVQAQGGMIDNPGVWADGTYSSGSKCGRAARTRFGRDYSRTLRLDYFTRLRTRLCGVGFHRIPVDRKSGAQIHADWLLGTNLAASHGCMRVSERLAAQIYSFARRRTTVVVKS